jgi:hypothetical protein
MTTTLPPHLAHVLDLIGVRNPPKPKPTPQPLPQFDMTWHKEGRECPH